MVSTSSIISAELELQVRKPPVISDNSTQSLVASEGMPVELLCYAGGFPIPKISWRRQNNAILPTGGSIYRYYLNIISVHFENTKHNYNSYKIMNFQGE